MSIHAMTLGFATCRVVELARVTTQARAPHENLQSGGWSPCSLFGPAVACSVCLDLICDDELEKWKARRDGLISRSSRSVGGDRASSRAPRPRLEPVWDAVGTSRRHQCVWVVG